VAPHCILVDQSGVRYMNEGGSYVAYCRNMLERNKTVAAVPSWAVMDHQGFKSVGIAGKKSLRKVKPWIESGFLKMADSIADLAMQMDCDPDVLQATIARFNAFARQGKDEDFNRGGRAYDRWLGNKYNLSGANFGELSKGPFFAFPVIPGDVSTYGGAVTDEHARVLNQDGHPIAGLYATGTSAASVFGQFYPGAGASIGPSATFGFLAAQHALTESRE
jgi:3-oxosteroid 1-dehydrogenase